MTQRENTISQHNMGNAFIGRSEGFSYPKSHGMRLCQTENRNRSRSSSISHVRNPSSRPMRGVRSLHQQGINILHIKTNCGRYVSCTAAAQRLKLVDHYLQRSALRHLFYRRAACRIFRPCPIYSYPEPQRLANPGPAIRSTRIIRASSVG